jgi:hypothetical protein
MKLNAIVALSYFSLYPVGVVGSSGAPTKPSQTSSFSSSSEVLQQQQHHPQQQQHRQLRGREHIWSLTNIRHRPGPSRPGEPAWSNPDTQFIPRQCASSEDCTDEEYCSSGICQSWGTCQDDFDCRNPQNTYPVIECTGPLKCTQGTCGRECGPTCPDGTNEVNCLASPCSIAKSTCETDFVSCIDDYCGGCSALVFDAAGNPEVCSSPNETDVDTSDVVPPSCNSTSDCESGSYCSSGECREMGMCVNTFDCRNPSNIYATILCIGPLYCNETSGSCGRECGITDCPGDAEPVQCIESPCTVLRQTCDEEIFECVDDYCGGCNALAFDASGAPVCNGTAAEPDPLDGGEEPEISCIATRDCPADHYCAAGACLPMGGCGVDLDCWNPNNMYPMVMCVGLLQCNLETKMCGVDCGMDPCKGGGQPVNCLARPCDVTTCDETFEYCLDDYCGGCNAVFLDSAGNRVCN